MKRILTLFICATGILQFQCTSNSEFDDIMNYPWKYQSGLNVGDWLEFQSGRYKFKHDTIFHQDSAVAKVTRLEHRIFSNDVELEIVSFDGMRGYYVSK